VCRKVRGVESADQHLPQPPTTKAAALEWRDRLRTEFRQGKFNAADASPDPAAPLTFGDVCDHYLRQHVRVPTRRTNGVKLTEMPIRLAPATEIPAAHGTTVRLEDKPIRLSRRQTCGRCVPHV
jgi:hypothetical protein